MCEEATLLAAKQWHSWQPQGHVNKHSDSYFQDHLFYILPQELYQCSLSLGSILLELCSAVM